MIKKPNNNNPTYRMKFHMSSGKQLVFNNVCEHSKETIIKEFENNNKQFLIKSSLGIDAIIINKNQVTEVEVIEE